MRKDIEIHINTGDVQFTDTRKYQYHQLHFIKNPQGLERFAYGEVVVSSSTSEADIRRYGIDFACPYTAIYKELYIRIKRESWGGEHSFVQNPVDGSEWFLVKKQNTKKNLFVSEMITIADYCFFAHLKGGEVELYSSQNLDFSVIGADRQNANLLLKCVPTNNYRFPLAGVGLIRWTNSNIKHTELAEVLRREFANDGVKVNNANYDFDTKGLSLDLETIAE